MYPNTPAGLAQQRAATSAFLPNQILPYAETYTLTIQRNVGSAFTAELGYVGTRGIHLPTQDQINKQPRVTAANELYTQVGTTVLEAETRAAATRWPRSTPTRTSLLAYLAAGFTSTITSYQPYSQSNYNGLVANLRGDSRTGCR